MANDDIQGTVTDGSGNPVQGATVALFLNNGNDGDAVLYTTTDANGNYLFDRHPQGNGMSQEWHITAYNEDGSGQFNSLSKPYVTASLRETIPDSVEMQYYGTTWSQGDTTWLDEKSNRDMSLTGDFQDATLSDDTEALSSDGTDDHGETTLPSTLEGTALVSFSAELAFEYTSSDFHRLTGVRNTIGGQWFHISVGADANAGLDSGNMYVTLDDQDGSRLQFGPSSNPNLNDGIRHNVSVIINDSSQNDVEMIIDGSSVDLTFDTTENPDNFGPWSYNLGTFASNNSGTIENYFDGKIGAIRWHDLAITEQTISDY